MGAFEREYYFERKFAWERLERVVEGVEEGAVRERREYKMFPRIGVDKWDDLDFLQRFRLSKHTVVQVLQMLQLQCNEERCVLIFTVMQ